MILLEYIRSIRVKLRDETFPEDDIIEAINQVVRDINTMGRFRFHESTYSVNLVADQHNYTIPGNSLSVKYMLYDAGNNNQYEIYRRREPWSGTPVVPNNNGNSIKEWWDYAGEWIFNPKPNTACANNNVTVFYDKDLTTMLSPTDTCGLPERYANVIIYGASFQLNPNLLVGQDNKPISTLFAAAIKQMKESDAWEYNDVPRVHSGRRWKNASSWGFNGKIY
jgi:hypothetical protein